MSGGLTAPAARRLGRTTYELIKLMVKWKEMGVDFKSISEGIDPSTKMGRLWYMLSSVFAENERDFNGKDFGRNGSGPGKGQGRRNAKRLD